MLSANEVATGVFLRVEMASSYHAGPGEEGVPRYHDGADFIEASLAQSYASFAMPIRPFQTNIPLPGLHGFETTARTDGWAEPSGRDPDADNISASKSIGPSATISTKWSPRSKRTSP